MYELYRYIFIGGLILSIIMLALTVFIFFFLDIKNAIGYVTGSSKRKALDNVKKGEESKKAENIVNNDASQQTSRLSIQERYDAMEESVQTSLLSKNTAPSSVTENKTRQQFENKYTPIQINDPDFVLVADITYVHSDEIIA